MMIIVVWIGGKIHFTVSKHHIVRHTHVDYVYTMYGCFMRNNYL